MLDPGTSWVFCEASVKYISELTLLTIFYFHRMAKIAISWHFSLYWFISLEKLGISCRFSAVKKREIHSNFIEDKRKIAFLQNYFWEGKWQLKTFNNLDQLVIAADSVNISFDTVYWIVAHSINVNSVRHWNRIKRTLIIMLSFVNVCFIYIKQLKIGICQTCVIHRFVLLRFYIISIWRLIFEIYSKCIWNQIGSSLTWNECIRKFEIISARALFESVDPYLFLFFKQINFLRFHYKGFIAVFGQKEWKAVKVKEIIWAIMF